MRFRQRNKILVVSVSVLTLGLILLLGARYYAEHPVPGQLNLPALPNRATHPSGEAPAHERVHLAQFNPAYRFSAEIFKNWAIEFVPQTGAINIYDPRAQAEPNLEKTAIFIRNFVAADFLTLATVDILNQQSETLSGHAARRYVIEKKSGLPNFPAQPSWRSGRHEVVDVQLAKTKPATYYVFARAPALTSPEFERFLKSLVFDNDAAGFVAPLNQVKDRVTKKKFGTYITPQKSPVQPERFKGYHTGADFEILPGEENIAVPVKTICGGPLRVKQIVEGYGGVTIQECLYNAEAVSVIYGHLDLASISAAEGNYLAPGTFLGNLGAAFSAETDGERRHLHLGIYLGQAADLRGYVQDSGELALWLDPLTVIK